MAVSKRIILMLFIFAGLLLFSSCDKIGGDDKLGGGILVGEDKKADARMEQIVSALKGKDKEALKSLFSNKALDEANSFDNEINDLFDLLQGDIISWERDGWASDESIESGKKSLMIRFAINVSTDKDVYRFFVIDYNMDTINPDNQGIYMLELIKDYGEKDLESWQDRMRAGIYIH